MTFSNFLISFGGGGRTVKRVEGVLDNCEYTKRTIESVLYSTVCWAQFLIRYPDKSSAWQPNPIVKEYNLKKKPRRSTVILVRSCAYHCLPKERTKFNTGRVLCCGCFGGSETPERWISRVLSFKWQDHQITATHHVTVTRLARLTATYDIFYIYTWHCLIGIERERESIKHKVVADSDSV